MYRWISYEIVGSELIADIDNNKKFSILQIKSLVEVLLENMQTIKLIEVVKVLNQEGLNKISIEFKSEK